MTTLTSCLAFTAGSLFFMTLTLTCCSGTDAMYVPRAMKRQESTFGVEDASAMALNNPQHAPAAGHEPSLFDLLITALRESEGNEETLKRGKQFKVSKPCYWSLVSCY